jgi:hypothetical protein
LRDARDTAGPRKKVSDALASRPLERGDLPPRSEGPKADNAYAPRGLTQPPLRGHTLVDRNYSWIAS